MSDLVEFLRARLDEDAAVARTAIESGDDYHGMGCEQPRAWQDFDTHCGPARMLAEVAAKRAIIDLHPDSGWSGACQGCEEHWPCRTLRHLGAVYSRHEDYREEEWRP